MENQLFPIQPDLAIISVEIGCRSDSECPSQTACINQQCVNPCTVADPCGTNAQCQVNYFPAIFNFTILYHVYLSLN